MSRVLRSTTALFAALAAATLAQGGRASEAEADGAAEPIVVTGERLEEPDAAALKTGTPLIDTPQSVTTVSREQLDNQALSSDYDRFGCAAGIGIGIGFAGFRPLR